MGGFASALGGLGGAAAQYGQQVRGILEQRRGAIADLFSRMANEEPDPSRRAEYLGHAADLLSGKDISKIAPAAIKTVQDHVQSNQQLAQIVGGVPQQPQQKPVAAGPGQVPGTATAAQPSSNPTQPSQQNFTPVGGMSPVQQPAPTPQASATPSQVPTIQGLPPGIQQPLSIQDIYNKWASNPLMQTPAGRAILKPFVEQEVAHNQALQQALEQQQVTLAYKRQALEDLRKTPGYHMLPPFAQAAYEAQAGNLTPVNMPQGMLVPTKYQSRAEELDPAVRKQYGLESYTGPVTISKSRLDGSITDIVPGNEGLTLINNADGTQSFVYKAVGPTGGVAASQIAPIKEPMANGQVGLTNAAQVAAGKPLTTIPDAVAPSTSATVSTGVRSIQTVDPTTGMPVTRLEPVTTTSQKVPSTGKAAVPPVSGAPTAPAPKVTPPAASGPREFAKPLTGSTQTMIEAAPKVLDLANKVLSAVGEQEKTLGPAKSRWSELFAGRIGAPNPGFTKLRTDSMLLETLLMRMHVGARGSGQMMSHFKDLMDYGKQSPENMKTALGEIISYANQVRGETPGSVYNKVPAVQGSQPSQPGAPTHRYNPATGKIEEIHH